MTRRMAGVNQKTVGTTNGVTGVTKGMVRMTGGLMGTRKKRPDGQDLAYE